MDEEYVYCSKCERGINPYDEPVVVTQENILGEPQQYFECKECANGR
jgi:hypothetical protein